MHMRDWQAERAGWSTVCTRIRAGAAYVRRQPERTALYRLLQQDLLTFAQQWTDPSEGYAAGVRSGRAARVHVLRPVLADRRKSPGRSSCPNDAWLVPN